MAYNIDQNSHNYKNYNSHNYYNKNHDYKDSDNHGQIMYFLETFMLPYVEIHLYPDNDQYGSMKAMEKINRTIAIFTMPLYIHRNMYPGEKDFGVSPDHIDEQIIQMR